MPLDMKDIQGLIHHSYQYPKARHLLFEVSDSTVGQKLLESLVPLTTHAEMKLDPPPDYLLNIGISYRGMLALGVNPDLMDRFPSEFKEDPDPNTMGDVGSSAPELWWNKRFLTSQVHLVIHLYGLTTDALNEITTLIRAKAGGLRELLPTQNGGPIEGGPISSTPGEVHFGYRDGFSQPDVRWDDAPGTSGSVDYRHFILGYSTENIPSQPKAYLSIPASVRAAIFAKNGCYSVFRWVYQDVARFNKFLAVEGPLVFPELPPEDAAELLAAKLMGRWRDGTPLIKSSTSPNPAYADDNSFGYSQDPHGLDCPVSSHIRINNPRDQKLDAASELLGGVPRVIRRGITFGSKLTGTEDDHEERGLVGMFLCASIQRQFYKLTAWMKENSFSPSFTDLRAQDPLANRNVPHASSEFLIPTKTGIRKVTLQDFVSTKGTAFFLLPSLTALQRLAAGELR